MQAFLVALLLLLPVGAYSDELADRLAAVPNPRQLNGSWVADPAAVIASRHDDINQLINGLEKDTSAEIAVVVLPTIGQLVPKDFAVALFNHWHIGKAGQDNGVLVLHILDQRRIEIETGYGMEGILPDAKCHWITEEIAVPFFKKSSYADGHYEVVRALTRAIKQPDIRHAELVSQWTTQPGDNTEALPSISAFDDIALEYASPSERLKRSQSTPWVLLALGGVFYLVITAVYRLRARGKDPYARYQLFNSGFARLQYAATLPVAASALVFENMRTDTFFSPLPVMLGLAFMIMHRRANTLLTLRNTPRTCRCGKPMRRLSESQDDAYIEKGQIAEEAINSVDYDVWLCACGQTTIESYKGRTPAKPCNKCHYRTYRVTKTRTLQAATTASSGLREITSTCANCHCINVTTETIPRIDNSSSSSGGSSSSSSSSSFGGGSSGGGGSGSSY